MSSSYCVLLLYQHYYTTMRKSTIPTTFVESFVLSSSPQSLTVATNARTMNPLQQQQQQQLRRCTSTSSSIRRPQLVCSLYRSRYYQRRQQHKTQVNYHTQQKQNENQYRWRSSSLSFNTASFVPTNPHFCSSRRAISSSILKVSQLSDASELGEEQQQQHILNDYDSSLIPTDHNSTAEGIASVLSSNPSDKMKQQNNSNTNTNNTSKSTRQAKKTTVTAATTKPRPSSSTTTRRSSSSSSSSSSSLQYDTQNDVYNGANQDIIYKTMSYAKFTTDVVFPTVNLPNNATTTTTTIVHDPYHPYNNVNHQTNDPPAKITHLVDLEQQRKQKVHPEYIVLSRTPIPISAITTTATDGSADHSSSITQLKDDTNYNSCDTCTSNEDLLDPYDLLIKSSSSSDGNTTATTTNRKKLRIPYMKALSPSSIKEFQACPQSFLFQYILGLRQPTTTILAKGTVCHAALERIFDIEPQDRSLHVLQNLFRTVWSEERNTDKYRFLFEEDILVDELVSETNSIDGTGIDVKSPQLSESTASPPYVQPVMERRRYIQKEISWGREGLALLENYWCAEDASTILRPNPIQREVWVRSNLPLLLPDTDRDNDCSETLSSLDRTITSNITAPVPANDELTVSTNCDAELDVLPNPMFINNSASDAITSTILPDFDNTNITNDDDDRDDEVVDESLDDTITTFENSNITNFLVRGIVDRLDMVQDAENKSQISLRLIDYKSGKAPDLKYSPAMNRKIQNEAFDQLLIYALLLRESNRNKVNPMPLRYLRLFYLTSVHDQKAIYWDMDLGATQEERDAILHTVHVSLSKIYKNICKMIDQQDFTAFHGCQRSFCYCHKCRPRFIPGTVWEPPQSSLTAP